MPDLIPTRYKSKLRKGLSYPVGAKMISELLAGVPQFTDLTVGFSERSWPLKQSEFAELLKTSKPIPIIGISYQNVSPGLTGSNYHIESGFYTESWDLLVFPVPSDLRHTVRERITTEGAAMLRNWLNTPRSMTWRTGRKTYALYYDRQDNILISKERDS